MNQPPPPGNQPTEAEMRAALEEEMRRITVDDVLLQTIVSLINLAGRKAGLVSGSEGERDLDQVRIAIEAVRAMLPLVEPRHAAELGPIKDALSQLQMAYAQLVGTGAPAPGTPDPGAPPADGAAPAAAPAQDAGGGGQGPAQSSGRLWIPGQ